VARDSGTTGSQTLGGDQQVLRTVSKALETVPIADTLYTLLHVLRTLEGTKP